MKSYTFQDLENAVRQKEYKLIEDLILKHPEWTNQGLQLAFQEYDLNLVRCFINRETELQFPVYDKNENIDIFLHEYTRSFNPYFPNQIFLHPEKDELVSEIPFGRIAKWVYNPTLTCKQWIQTPYWHFHQMELSPDGKKIIFTTRKYEGFIVYDYELLQSDFVIGKELSKTKYQNWYCDIFTIDTHGRIVFADLKLDKEPEYIIIDLESKTIKIFPMLLDKWIKDDLYSIESIGSFSPNGRKIVMSIELQSQAERKLVEFGLREDLQIESNILIQEVPWIVDIKHSKNGKWLLAFGASYCEEDKWGYIYIYNYSTNQYKEIPINQKLTHKPINWNKHHPYMLNGSESYGYSGKVMIGEKEFLCTVPGGYLLFFDLQSGEFLREQKVSGSKIYAVGSHPTIPNKIRVATDEVLEVVDLY